MMRSILLSLMFSGSVLALSTPANAQSAPDTRQTDQSEEDWRKSQKKGGTTTEDILDIFENTRGTGVGNGQGYSPIDALPEESRRHLMKERARRLAEAGLNEPVDVSFEPSEAAKSDPDLKADEKEAWDNISKNLNGTTPSNQTSQAGNSGTPNQAGQAPASQGSSGSSESSQQNPTTRSVIRGGSAQSVADILSRIKGLNQGGDRGQSPQAGQGQSGRQSQEGQAQRQANAAKPSLGQNTGEQNTKQGSESQSPQGQQAQAQGEQDSSQTEQAQNNAPGQQNSQQQSGGDAAPLEQASTRSPDAISPLDRIKQVNRENETSGSRFSASDYLKKKD